MNKYAVKDMYKEYKELHPESDVTYSLFSHYIERFNKKIIEKVLEGKAFYFGHNLGSVRITMPNEPSTFDLRSLVGKSTSLDLGIPDDVDELRTVKVVDGNTTIW